MANEKSKQSPDQRDIAIERMLPALTIVRDVYAGTLRIRDQGEKYLPRFELEEESDYETRKNQSVLFNALKRTVKGLAGMVFRKPIALGDDVAVKIRGQEEREATSEVSQQHRVVGHWENIDMAGRHGDVFCRDVFEDALLDGHACIFVDMPVVEPGVLTTLRDEREAGVRPYWIAIRKQQILRVRTINIAGRIVLSRFAYIETVTEDDGEFGQREVERVRDYQLVGILREGERQQQLRVQYVIYTKRKDGHGKEEWQTTPASYMEISRIPVATAYTNRTGFMESEPPLLDLALENIDHYQTRSDRKNVMHVASVPIPVIAGARSDSKTIKVGVNSALELNEGGSASYLEPQGAALDHSKEELEASVQRMAALGLSMLLHQARAAETAEGKRIDKSEADSQLASAARGLEDAVEEALELHALWMDSQEGGSCEVNRDFGIEPLDAQTLNVLASMVPGKLSLTTLWEVMKRGEILPDTFDEALERERLEDEGGEGLDTLLRLAKKTGISPERTAA